MKFGDVVNVKIIYVSFLTLLMIGLTNCRNHSAPLKSESAQVIPANKVIPEQLSPLDKRAHSQITKAILLDIPPTHPYLMDANILFDYILVPLFQLFKMKTWGLKTNNLC